MRQRLAEERMKEFLDYYTERNPDMIEYMSQYIENAQAADGPRNVVDIGTDALEQYYGTLGHHIADVGTMANHTRVLYMEWVNLKMDPDRAYPFLNLFPKENLDNDTLTFKVFMSALTDPAFTPATEGTLPRIAGAQYTEKSFPASRVHVGLQADLTAIMTTLGAKEAVAHAGRIRDAAACNYDGLHASNNGLRP